MSVGATRSDRGGRRREIARYVAWQVPGWVLVALVAAAATALLDLSAWIAAAVVGVFVAKDLLLFPVMRAVFRRPGTGGVPAGSRGEAVEALAPTGYVRVNGELWRARTRGGVIAAGARVRVVEARGLTLLVEPE